MLCSADGPRRTGSDQIVSTPTCTYNTCFIIPVSTGFQWLILTESFWSRFKCRPGYTALLVGKSLVQWVHSVFPVYVHNFFYLQLQMFESVICLLALSLRSDVFDCCVYTITAFEIILLSAWTRHTTETGRLLPHTICQWLVSWFS